MRKIFILGAFLLSYLYTQAQTVDFNVTDSITADEVIDLIQGSGIETIFNVRMGAGGPYRYGSFNTYGIDNDFNMNKGFLCASMPLKALAYGLGYPATGHFTSPGFWAYPVLDPEDTTYFVPTFDTFLANYFLYTVYPSPPHSLYHVLDTSSVFYKSLSGYRLSLQFDFVPTGDTISFKYIAYGTSLSYPCDSGPGWLFSAFLSGSDLETPVNIATVPATNTIVGANTIGRLLPGTEAGLPMCQFQDSAAPYTEYYIDNDGSLLSEHVSFPGYTVPLEAVYKVNPCDTYSISITLLCRGSNYRGFAIEANSFRSNGPQSCTAIDTTTSILPGSAPEDFCLAYPNPFSESLQISLKGNTPIAEEYQVHIIDINGRVVFEQKGSLRAINRSLLRIGKELDKGMYLLSIEDTKDYRRQLIKILRQAEN